MSMFGRFSLNQLQAMPTITQGQDADLKFEQMGTRVWLNRIDTTDGAEYDNLVTVERHVKGAWTTIDTYQATDFTEYADDHPYFNVSPALVAKQERIAELIDSILEPIDELNGLLEDVLEETKHLDDKGDEEVHTGHSAVNDFYMALPVHSTLTDINATIAELVNQAVKIKS